MFERTGPELYHHAIQARYVGQTPSNWVEQWHAVVCFYFPVDGIAGSNSR